MPTLNNAVKDYDAVRAEAYSLPKGATVAVLDAPQTGSRAGLLLVEGDAKVVDADGREFLARRRLWVRPEELSGE